MTATRNNLKSVSVFGNSVNSLSPGEETIIPLSRSRLSVKKTVAEKMAEKSPVLGKKWVFCKGFAGCFPRILLTGRSVFCKKTLGIEKTYKKTVGLDRPYISHICIRGKHIFGRFWVAFDGF